MNKTIEEHFYDSMPAPIAAIAIRNTDEDLLHMSICQTPAAALQKAFDWAVSDQGYAFWSSVFDTVSGSRDFRDLKVNEYDLAMAGLDKLLEYVKNPRQYVRKSMMVNNPSDDDLEDYKAWAQSRARYILEKLYSSNIEDSRAKGVG